MLMMETFEFLVDGQWNGGRLGDGKVTTEGFSVAVSVPKDMGGPGIGANPEELLIASAANCYMITLAAVLEKREVKIDSFVMKTEGTVAREGGKLKFERIVHKPHLILSHGGDEQIKFVEECTHRAEKACFISQTLKGSVEVSVEPVVEVKG
jgi:peroxiredoxin-like protein